MIVLTIVTMLYIIAPVFIYLITESLYFLTIFIQFLHPTQPPPPASGNCKSDLSLFNEIFAYFRFHIWGHTMLVFLWLISLSIMPSRSIYVVANFLLFCGLINISHPLNCHSLGVGAKCDHIEFEPVWKSFEKNKIQ